MKDNTKERKKLLIIGGGISGLTAGIYALENNFDVTIYEKHTICGGQCTGWNRKQTFIDGCAHWIVGTNPNSKFNKIWKHIGAINDETKIYPTEYFSKIEVDGQVVTLYSNLDKLKKELLRISPEDKARINHFIHVIKAYQHVQIPLKKPMDKMNLFELSLMGIKMLPMVPYYIHYRKESVVEYGNKFKSPILKEAFRRVMGPNYNIHSMFYTFQALSLDDAGMMEGGSRNLAFRIKDKFLSLGGKLQTNTPVKEIIIENNIATGIKLESNEVINADYIICSTDIHYALNNLLNNKYSYPYFEEKFQNKKYNPLQTCCLYAYKVNKPLENYPKQIDLPISPISYAGMTLDHITLRNYSFDKTLNQGTTLVISMLLLDDEGVYDYLKGLNKEEYLAFKAKHGELIRQRAMEYYQLKDEDITLIDVTTPLTYERYTNAYKGSYMSFITTKKTKGLMTDGLIKEIDNLVLCGQWIMPPGGLPIAIFTGKHAAYRVTRMSKQKFIDADFNSYNNPFKVFKLLRKKTSKI